MEALYEEPEFSHQPVMLPEVIQYLAPRPGSVFVDCTLGGAGHANEVLKHLMPGGRLIGIDQDAMALQAAGERLAPFGAAVELVHDNFARLREILERLGLSGVDGILLDLGVSSPQLDAAERGFSYKADAPLDMRMDQRISENAADLVNNLSEDDLTRIIGTYGEERWARRIARFIDLERKRGPIGTTGALVDIIKAAIPASARRTGPHPAKRTFQALRMAVNRELEVLEEVLRDAPHCLNPGGRLVVLSFHSLEDRLVKHTLREFAMQSPDLLRVLTKKPVIPSEEEIESNARSRSTKLRAAERPV